MHIKPISMGASVVVLALMMWGGTGAHAADGACTLSSEICAKEGVVLIAPHADPLTSWDKGTDFQAIDALAGAASYTLANLGARQAVALLLGGGDLVTGGYDQLIHEIVARGGTVIVTDPSPRDAKRLDSVADIRGARWRQKDEPRLYGLREAVAGDGHTYPTAFVLLPDEPGRRHRRHRQAQARPAELGNAELAWLEKLIGRDPPAPYRGAASAAAQSLAAVAPSSNDLIDLVQAKHTSVLKVFDQDELQLDNFIYGARSFLNKEDLYYVDQEIQFVKKHYLSQALSESYSANLPERPSASSNVTLLRPSPETTLQATTYTTGVNFGIGGNAGYFSDPGRGANVAPNLTFTKSETTTVPPLNLTYRPNLPLAESHWIITENTDSGNNAILLHSSWIWAVPLNAYRSEQEPFLFDSVGKLRATGSTKAGSYVTAFTAEIESLVDQPFPTKTILPPSIASVTPNEVPVAGQATIAGQGLYPGLFQNVLLGGNALPAANVTNASDTQIIVTVPNNASSFPPDKPLAVQVNTSAGASNNNERLTILSSGTAQASPAQSVSAQQ